MKNSSSFLPPFADYHMHLTSAELAQCMNEKLSAVLGDFKTQSTQCG